METTVYTKLFPHTWLLIGHPGSRCTHIPVNPSPVLLGEAGIPIISVCSPGTAVQPAEYQTAPPCLKSSGLEWSITHRWVRSKLWNGLEHTSWSWPGTDNAKWNGRTPFGAFCQNGQVNVIPGRNAGATQRAKIGQRTDPSGSLRTFTEGSQGLRGTQGTPVLPHSPSNYSSSSRSTSPREPTGAWPRGLSSHPAVPSLSALRGPLVIFFTAFLIRQTLDPRASSNQASGSPWRNWSRVKNKPWWWPWKLFSPHPARVTQCKCAVTSSWADLRITKWETEKMNSVSITVILLANFKIKLSVRKSNVLI